MSRLLSRYDRFIATTALVALGGGFGIAMIFLDAWVQGVEASTTDPWWALFCVISYLVLVTSVGAITFFGVVVAAAVCIALVRKLPRLFRPISEN